jgi:plastocyanin
MHKVFIALGLLLLCPVLGAAEEAQKRSVTATVDADGVQRVQMVGGGYYFDPYHVRVKVDVPVELHVVKDKGMVPHNIVLRAPEAGIDFDENLGSEPKIIRFTPTRTGSYPFACSKRLLFFESHQDKGMEGVLEVVD